MPEKKHQPDSRFLNGAPIAPPGITGGESAAELVERAFIAYNAGRLRDACRLFVRRLLEPDVTVGLSLSGALTPAGLGMSALIPLVQAGFIDWVVSTGANLYHDTHFGIGLQMREGRHDVSDVVLREEGVVRIHDIFFDYDVLLSTDAFFRKIFDSEEFQRPMGTAEFHHLCGKYVVERERALGLQGKSFLAACFEAAVPVYTSAPGDSSIGMNVAERALAGGKLRIDPGHDVNESAALVLAAKRAGGKSAVLIMGGGSPKNFVLQTEPQIQEVLGLEEAGHDYYIQFTDARPDTGGLSGATPSEAVSWGKVDPSALPDTIVCYLDVSVALPLFTAYALAHHAPREPKRLYDRREELLSRMSDEYRQRARGR